MKENVGQINQARNTLTDELKKSGVMLSKEIERAFRVVPRHILLKGVVDPIEAYTNKTIVFKRDEDGIVFEKGRTLSSSTLPILVAAMLEFLDVSSGMKVLEIGTASGYNAALLAEIVGCPSKVYTIEIDKEVTERAQKYLQVAGYGEINVILRDGGYGYQEAAPYDRMIVTAGCSDFSSCWLKQLKEEGSLVCPFSFSKRGGSYPVVRLTKIQGKYLGEFTSGLDSVGFVPLYGDFETLTYDGATFNMLENLRKRWFTETRSREEASGLMLLTHVYVAHCSVVEPSPYEVDGHSIDSLVAKIEKEWVSLGRPTPSDFSLRLLDNKTEPQKGGWLFKRKNWNIVVQIENT